MLKRMNLKMITAVARIASKSREAPFTNKISQLEIFDQTDRL